MSVFLIIGPVFLLGGLGCLAGAAFSYRQQRRFLARAVAGTGVVTDLHWRSAGRGGRVAYPVIRYTTAEGQVLEREAPEGANPPAWRQGQEVRILYDPSKPAEFNLAGGWWIWLGSLIWLGIGILFLILGTVFTTVGFALRAVSG